MDKNEDFKNEVKFRISMLKMDDEKKNNNYNFINKKFAVVACTILVFSTGVVFAKDIDNYLKKLFSNSNKAIDVAVENGYVQQENTYYTYDKDIGIKVDSLVLDDLNLNISFNFETKKENIKSIRFKDFIITNNNEKIIYRSEFKSSETLDELPLYNSVNWINEPIKVTATTFTDSILFGLRPEKEDFNKLYFDIKSVQIIYMDDTNEIINGTWNFKVTISDEMRKSAIVIYNMNESNEYIESCVAKVSNTGTDIELIFKERIPQNEDVFLTDLIYICSNNKTYRDFWIEYNEKDMAIHFRDISNFIENSNTLELHLDFFNTIVILTKINN